MYSFLIFSIPAAVLFYCLSNTEYEFRDFIAPILAGLCSGIFISLFKEYFIFSSYIATSGFIRYFFHAAKAIIIPQTLLLAAWNFFSKDSDAYKTEAVFPVLASFYSVFLPYISISSQERHSVFFLFASPLLVICSALFSQAVYAKIKLPDFRTSKKNFIVCILIFIAGAAFPSAAQTLWYFKFPLILQLLTMVLFAAVTFIFHKVSLRHENSLDTIR
ncbi:hypothetical protein [Treponema sp.]|uniref:hypothetical protein n=1 Tax=Treponema sp. TaxID=166 RepID=UPI003F0C4901